MKFLLVACGLMLLVLSCKKKDKPSTNSGGGGGTTTAGSTTGGSTTSGAVITTTATSFHGFFVTSTYTVHVGLDTYTNNAAFAGFTTQPVPAFVTGPGVYAGKVAVREDSLYFNSITSGYGYYLHELDAFSDDSWTFAGLNGFPSFTLSNGIARPQVSNLNSIPSIVLKSERLTFTLNNIANFKSSTLLITDGSSSINGTLVLPVNAGSNVINITASQLNAFATGTTGMVLLTLENSQSAAAGGKNFKFIKQLQYAQSLNITN